MQNQASGVSTCRTCTYLRSSAEHFYQVRRRTGALFHVVIAFEGVELIVRCIELIFRTHRILRYGQDHILISLNDILQRLVKSPVLLTTAGRIDIAAKIDARCTLIVQIITDQFIHFAADIGTRINIKDGVASLVSRCRSIRALRNVNRRIVSFVCGNICVAVGGTQCFKDCQTLPRSWDCFSLVYVIAVFIYEINKILRQKLKLSFILCIIYSKEDIRHGGGNIGPHVHRTVRNGVDPDLGLGGLVGLEMVHIDMGQIVRRALDDKVGEIIRIGLQVLHDLRLYAECLGTDLAGNGVGSAGPGTRAENIQVRRRNELVSLAGFVLGIVCRRHI